MGPWEYHGNIIMEYHNGIYGNIMGISYGIYGI